MRLFLLYRKIEDFDYTTKKLEALILLVLFNNFKNLLFLCIW